MEGARSQELGANPTNQHLNLSTFQPFKLPLRGGLSVRGRGG